MGSQDAIKLRAVEARIAAFLCVLSVLVVKIRNRHKNNRRAR